MELNSIESQPAVNFMELYLATEGTDEEKEQAALAALEARIEKQYAEKKMTDEEYFYFCALIRIRKRKARGYGYKKHTIFDIFRRDCVELLQRICPKFLPSEYTEETRQKWVSSCSSLDNYVNVARLAGVEFYRYCEDRLNGSPWTQDAVRTLKRAHTEQYCKEIREKLQQEGRLYRNPRQ